MVQVLGFKSVHWDMMKQKGLRQRALGAIWVKSNNNGNISHMFIRLRLYFSTASKDEADP